MTEQQPGGVLDEAVKLLDVLRRRAACGGSAARDGADVWGDAVRADPPHVTGAGPCRDCPVCRGRAAAPDVRRHVAAAGRSLLAAVRDVAAAAQRPAPGSAAGPRRPSSTPEAGHPGADRGNPWAAATGDPADIG
ncbi:hypothetical protein [Actinomadura flavalba]|uniref:hypothetical protein n=1 Tax=Actinomadura flavalba TaxID=1120938 RepID=UPI0003725807|nr:hypothetical protein [Actinomadura flavalba]